MLFYVNEVCAPCAGTIFFLVFLSKPFLFKNLFSTIVEKKDLNYRPFQHTHFAFRGDRARPREEGALLQYSKWMGFWRPIEPHYHRAC